MAKTTTAVVVHCNQCFKRFEGATQEKAVRSFKGHATRMGHVNMYTVEDNSVVEEPTNIDEAREAKTAAKTADDAAKAERKATREAAAEAKAAEKAERATAREAAKAEREVPRTTPCECGCGAIPSGRKSRFLPGHDAKKASAEKAEAEAAAAK